MQHDSAVQGGKQGFQLLVFLDNFLGVGAFLRNINGQARRPHDAAVHVVQRGFIGGKNPRPLAGLDGFFAHAGFPRLHNGLLGFDTGGIVKFHIPNIGVSASFHVFFGFVNHPAESVVYFLMDTVFIFVPNQIGAAVNGTFQVLGSKPKIFTQFKLPLPAGKAKPNFGLGHRQNPYVRQSGQKRAQFFALFGGNQGDNFPLRFFMLQDFPHRLGGVLAA